MRCRYLGVRNPLAIARVPLLAILLIMPVPVVMVLRLLLSLLILPSVLKIMVMVQTILVDSKRALQPFSSRARR